VKHKETNFTKNKGTDAEGERMEPFSFGILFVKIMKTPYEKDML
jgi:hypothetical protein